MRLIRPVFLFCLAFAAATPAGADTHCPARIIGGYGDELELTNVAGDVVARLKLGKRGVLATPLPIFGCLSTSYKVVYENAWAFVLRPAAVVDGDIVPITPCAKSIAGTVEGKGSAAESHAFEACRK